jgi:hypothetical protein
VDWAVTIIFIRALKGIDALIKIAEDKFVGYHNFNERLLGNCF